MAWQYFYSVKMDIFMPVGSNSFDQPRPHGQIKPNYLAKWVNSARKPKMVANFVVNLSKMKKPLPYSSRNSSVR